MQISTPQLVPHTQKLDSFIKIISGTIHPFYPILYLAYLFKLN